MIVLSIVIGLTFGAVLAPAVVTPSAAPQAVAVEQAADDRAMCAYPVAGWLVKWKPCKEFDHLPDGVKECLFAVFGAGVVSFGWGAPLAPAVASALVGCGGKLLSSS